MEERTIKRSIRLPLDVHEALMEEAKERGRSGNQVILDVLRGKVWNRGKGEEKGA